MATSEDAGTQFELRNWVIAFAALLFGQAVSATTATLVAAFLQPDQFGTINLARTLFLLMPVCCSLGLEYGLQRHLASYGDNLGSRLRHVGLLRTIAFGLSLLLALAWMLGGAALLEETVFQYTGFAFALTVTVLALPFATDLAVLGGAFRGIHLSTPSIVAQTIIQPAARMLVVAICLFQGYAFLALPLGIALGNLAAWARLAPLAARRLATPVSWRAIPVSELNPIIAYSVSLSVSVIIVMVTRMLDLLLLGYFRSPTELGRYSLVLLMTQLIALTGVASGQTLGARVAMAHSAGQVERVKGIQITNMNFVAIICAPLFACIAFWGNRIDLLIGEGYQLDWRVIALAASASVVIGVMGNLSNTLAMTGHHKTEVAIIAAGFLVQVVGCVLLIPTGGQLGAAMATFVTSLFIWLARWWTIKRLYYVSMQDFRVIYPLAIAVTLSMLVFLLESVLTERTVLSTALSCAAVFGLYAMLLPATAALVGIESTMKSLQASWRK